MVTDKIDVPPERRFVGIDPNEWVREKAMEVEEVRALVEAKRPTFLSVDDFDAFRQYLRGRRSVDFRVELKTGPVRSLSDAVELDSQALGDALDKMMGFAPR